MRKIFACLVFCTCTIFADMDMRSVELSKHFRCLTCDNQSVFDSGSDFAVEIKEQIEDLIAAGNSDSEIYHYMVSTYGQSISYAPKLDRSSYVLYFMPLFIFLLGGGFILYRYVKAWRGN